MQLSEQLKEILVKKYGKKGYQTRCSEDTGIPQPRISEALNVDRDLYVSNLVKIADALGCDIKLVPRSPK